MTKQSHTANPAGDRPAFDHLVCEIGSLQRNALSPLGDCGMQASQGFAHTSMKPFKRGNNGLALQGLAIAEAYLKGDVLLYAHFERNIDQVTGVGIRVANQGEAADNPTVIQNHVLERDFLNRWQEANMLVRDVEYVNRDQVTAIPTWKRLYYVEDVADDSRAWPSSAFGMSFDGTLKVLPRPLFGKGEFHILIDGSPIGFDQDAVGMVERGSEVMDSIPQDCRSVPRERLPKLIGDLPSVTIELGAHSLFVRSFVGAENTFKLKDVVLGPLGL